MSRKREFINIMSAQYESGPCMSRLEPTSAGCEINLLISLAYLSIWLPWLGFDVLQLGSGLALAPVKTMATLSGSRNANMPCLQVLDCWTVPYLAIKLLFVPTLTRLSLQTWSGQISAPSLLACLLDMPLLQYLKLDCTTLKGHVSQDSKVHALPCVNLLHLRELVLISHVEYGSSDSLGEVFKHLSFPAPVRIVYKGQVRIPNLFALVSGYTSLCSDIFSRSSTQELSSLFYAEFSNGSGSSSLKLALRSPGQNPHCKYYPSPRPGPPVVPQY